MSTWKVSTLVLRLTLWCSKTPPPAHAYGLTSPPPSAPCWIHTCHFLCSVGSSCYFGVILKLLLWCCFIHGCFFTDTFGWNTKKKQAETGSELKIELFGKSRHEEFRNDHKENGGQVKGWHGEHVHEMNIKELGNPTGDKTQVLILLPHKQPQLLNPASPLAMPPSLINWPWGRIGFLLVFQMCQICLTLCLCTYYSLCLKYPCSHTCIIPFLPIFWVTD